MSYRQLSNTRRPAGTGRLSPEGRIISWNRGAARIYAYPAEDILGRHFSLFYPKEDVQSGKPAMELEIALADGRYEEEGWRLRRDEGRFWANVVISPVRDQSGNLVGFAKITRDLTDRRRAREELIASQQQTRELSLENAAKDEFLGIIAHELRNPLAVLYGGAQFLRSHFDAIPDKDKAELIDGLAGQADGLRQLLDNPLALSGIGRGEVILEDASLERVAAAVAAFEQRSPSRRVELHLQLEGVRVRIEKTYFERVLQNLLENADKYSPEDQPVEVWSREERGEIWLEVRDRGPGVDAAELSRIFESFYRSRRAAPKLASREGGGLILRITLPAETGAARA